MNWVREKCLSELCHIHMIINSHFVRLMKRENMHYFGQMKRLEIYITQYDLGYTGDIKMMMVIISGQRDNAFFYIPFIIFYILNFL